MSDSDEDLMADSVARLQHHTFNRRAPNMNNTNITSFSFGNNMMTSTFRSNYERQRNGMQNSNQRNICNRRETSPMSLKSFPDSGMQNFRNYPNGMSSCNRSVFNGRSGSPMSMRSIDSNVSVSATDIAFAFKNVKFNKNDLRLIKDAYNKFMKNQARKRIMKRRNLKLFLKGYRRKSGEDSGEQGSDSSISSDDCRSTRTFYTENRFRSGPKSTISDINHFRSTIRESDMYRDCSERFQQTKLRNMFAISNTNVDHAVNDTSIHQNHKISHKELPQTRSMATLKDRFTKNANSFLLPSQRFNNSTTIPKNQENTVNVKKGVLRTNNNIVEQNKSLDSDSEEIFSEITIRENTQIQQKRVLEDSEINSPDKKRYKSAPQTKLNDVTNVTNSDFNFKKPQMPVRKSGNNKKNSAPERIIAMSKPLIGDIDLEKPKKLPKNIDDTQKPVNSTEIEESTNQTVTTQNSTDVSMRPSFIKRKLFTQKLDVVEKDNFSSDSNGANSPHTNMYSECRERNKVRRLVTSHSCLSRDIMSDDNVLDLIHKIVPPDKMNMTTASNKKEVNKSNDIDNDKWDVTSVISTCNIGDVSDTFTDEEIFKAPSKVDNKLKKDQKVNESVAVKTDLPKPVKKPITQCKVVVEKLSPVPNSKQNQNLNLQKNGDGGNKSELPNKRTVSSCIKSFWDTDFESDMEDRTGTPWKPKIQLNSGKGVQKNVASDNSKMNFSKKSASKGTILTIRSLQNKTVNSSMRSDISRVSKRNIEIQENKENNNTPNKNNKNLKNNNTLKKNNKNLNNNKKEDEIQPKEKNLKNTKSKQKDETTKINNEKPKAKPAQSKTKNTTTQNSKKESPCNTSRESLRLKQKNEKKVNNTTNNTLNNAVKSRGRPRKSEQDQDSIKTNLNKNSKATKTNKTNDKPVKKNATLNRPKPQTPQRKQNTRLFSTPISDSSFNISNRSLRIRHR